MLIITLLVTILIILAIVQTQMHLTRVRHIPTRILVNGTRGKTTVTRLLASAISSAGHSVLARTTGSEAALILPNGTIRPVNRHFGPRLQSELIAFFKLAIKLKADVVVIECMAVRPESQLLISSMVQPTISIITNARVDHIDQMGDTIQSTANVLKLSVPTGHKFYTSDSFFISCPYAVFVTSSDLISTTNSTSTFTPSTFDAIPTPEDSNKSLVLRITSDLGMEESVALAGLSNFVPDIGLVGPFDVDNHYIINAFAANDLQSAEELLQNIEDYDNTTIIYNNRSDREFRLLFFAKAFSKLKNPHIIVIGERTKKCVRYLNRTLNQKKIKNTKPNIQSFSGSDQELLKLCRNTIICMGNIRGKGVALINYCLSHNNLNPNNSTIEV